VARSRRRVGNEGRHSRVSNWLHGPTGCHQLNRALTTAKYTVSGKCQPYREHRILHRVRGLRNAAAAAAVAMRGCGGDVVGMHGSVLLRRGAPRRLVEWLLLLLLLCRVTSNERRLATGRGGVGNPAGDDEVDVSAATNHPSPSAAAADVLRRGCDGSPRRVRRQRTTDEAHLVCVFGTFCRAVFSSKTWKLFLLVDRSAGRAATQRGARGHLGHLLWSTAAGARRVRKLRTKKYELKKKGREKT
jgi:hypothetical protein